MNVKIVIYKFNSDSSRKELYRNQIELSDDFVFDPRNFYSVFSLLYPGAYLEFTLLLNY